MNKWQIYPVTILIPLFVVIVTLLAITYHRNRTVLYDSKDLSTMKDMFDENDYFIIHNYLKTPVMLAIDKESNSSVASLSITLDSMSKKKVSISNLKLFKRGIKIQVYLPNNNATLGEYVLTGNLTNDLYIGMITSRWIGSNSDYNIGKPGLNAVQGVPWIRIHNQTNNILRLNNNIVINPNEMLRYAGRDHFGVRLGTVFKDQDNIFQDFIFTVPATDIYYGIVSNIEQAQFGGFQLKIELDHYNNEPQYLLESGLMGGPKTANIDYNSVLQDYKTNRWGELK